MTFEERGKWFIFTSLVLEDHIVSIEMEWSLVKEMYAVDELVANFLFEVFGITPLFDSIRVFNKLFVMSREMVSNMCSHKVL